MRHEEWGLLIVIYLFLGGLSAGAMVISGLAQLLGRGERFAAVARAGAYLAPFPVLLGTGLQVLDLGRPFRFWKLFLAFEPESPMWIGSWLLALFLAVSLPYLNLFLPQERRVFSPGRPTRWKNALAAAGIPVGVGVGIYTGVLLGAIPARPFWNTPMVAQLFLFSGLSTGSALLMLALPRLVPGKEAEPDRRALLSADVVFILLELSVIAPFIIHGELSTRSARQSLDFVLGGPLTAIFWVGVVALGLMVPLATEVAAIAFQGRVGAPKRLFELAESAAGILVLAGGLLLRYVFVKAGQLSALI